MGRGNQRGITPTDNYRQLPPDPSGFQQMSSGMEPSESASELSRSDPDRRLPSAGPVYSSGPQEPSEHSLGRNSRPELIETQTPDCSIPIVWGDGSSGLDPRCYGQQQPSTEMHGSLASNPQTQPARQPPGVHRQQQKPSPQPGRMIENGESSGYADRDGNRKEYNSYDGRDYSSGGSLMTVIFIRVNLVKIPINLTEHRSKSSIYLA
ncbi:unnamed protein product [Protopolystoma xenopodis]|uniref:Uncharacterized protein n=1 Tax=Protopolystoma xenopodis TaxID=117903 RepID=A0A3S5A0Y4_9PLAT|nr:unnamed protein product [Protopolystoma xenopodis]